MSEVVTSPGAAAEVGKSPFKSKTLVAAALTAVTPFVPVLGPWVAANPQLWSVALGVIFGALRLATKNKIEIQ